MSRSLDKRIVPKVDKHLATVEHKEGRYGKSQGMFSLDDILKHGNSSGLGSEFFRTGIDIA